MALARRTCSSNGGELASITSAEENEEVTRIANGNVVWIGGIRKGSGNGPGANHWYWSDGRPWTYTNWHPGEPNNYGGVENRVQLGLGPPERGTTFMRDGTVQQSTSFQQKLHLQQLQWRRSSNSSP